ncbi:putative PGG domain-containing protein [Helianthus debilis subsp. tardiflorus]
MQEELVTYNIITSSPDSTNQNTKQASVRKEQVVQLQTLISEHLVTMHDEIQKIIKNIRVSTKQYPIRKLHNVIFEHIANMHDKTQNIIEITKREDQVPELKQVISEQIRIMELETSKIISEARVTYSSRVLFIAAEIGNTNFLVELIRQYPDLIWKVNERETRGCVRGCFANAERVVVVQVGSMVPPSCWEQKNKDGLTPRELFTEEHKELIREGEKWMKETSSQCMVVAALIATMVFAAAFTVPASILTFLSILTSRYAERDFVESLPTKLLLGLLTLFLSTMVIAFSISFFILYHTEMKWIPVLMSVVALMPVLLYVVLQYHMLADVIRSSYGSRYLFKPEKQVLYYVNTKPQDLTIVVSEP